MSCFRLVLKASFHIRFSSADGSNVTRDTTTPPLSYFSFAGAVLCYGIPRAFRVCSSFTLACSALQWLSPWLRENPTQIVPMENITQCSCKRVPLDGRAGIQTKGSKRQIGYPISELKKLINLNPSLLSGPKYHFLLTPIPTPLQ